jgi:hypothetical protein
MTDPDDIRREEELLEGVLSSRQLPDGADAQTRDLFGFVQACREAANAPVDTGEVAARCLAISTREDLSWRGDMRDISRFVRDRMRSSAALRLAAASLLLHLAALPVVALYVLTEEPAVPEFRVEVSNRNAPFDNDQSAEPEPGLEISDPGGFDALLVENTLRWTRYQLEESRHKFMADELPVPLWLSERIDVLYGSHVLDPIATSPLLPEALVQVELALDEHLMGPRRASFPVSASQSLDLLADSLDLTKRSSAWLAASALARAESYGLSTPKSALALALAREKLALGDERRPLIEVIGDVRALMPIDPLWLEAARTHKAECASESLVEGLRSFRADSNR